MRSLALASLSLVSLVVGCGDDGASRRLPPDTSIDDHPAALTNQTRATISFHAGGVADRFTCALDHGAEVACSSPFTADVTDGDHAFLVRAALGEELDTTPAELTWTVDTMPPDTSITSAPPALDNTAAPEIVFAGTDNRAEPVTYECAVDGAAFAACTSPTTLATLADGGHSFQVRAVDAAGNPDATPASVTWTLDTTAPDTMITSGPAAGSFTKAAVAFAFASPDSPVTFECAVDAGAFAACASPKSLTLAEGAHTFKVRAKDAAGLVDPSPATRAWTVDLTPPVVAITSGPTGVTNDATPSFDFTVTGATTIECQTDGGAFAACTSPYTTAALADGNHAITVRGTDAAGNTGTASRSFSIDTVPPTIAIAPVNPNPTTDRTPTISFSTAGGATTIQCQTDGGAFAACASPVTTASLADGNHTFSVRAVDAAGNPAVAAISFAVDATPPAVTITDAPPALWPVNYFDFKFATTDATATLTCALNGAALPSCASPLTVTVAYNAASTFTVTARDPAGNTATASHTWTPKNGLVLHYPWEQGDTANTSLLAQKPGYSPDGTATLPVVGGWAGAAAGAPPAHGYKGTIRALSSSANGQYTASVWVRVRPGSNGGTVLSTLAANNGFSLSLEGRQAILRVADGGAIFTASAVVPPGQWVQLGVLTTGPAKGLQLLVNGNPVAIATPPTSTGFGPGQAADLTVGRVFDVDLDDLRFYNRALAGTELCTLLARGTINANGGCDALVPGLELAFENSQIVDTGNWNLQLSAPSVISFLPTKLGSGLRIDRNDQTFAYAGFASRVNTVPGHSIALWYVGGSPTDILYDTLQVCAPGAAFTCGIRVIYAQNQGIVVGANGGAQTPFTVAIPNTVAGNHSLLITEQKTAQGLTQQLSIYLDGVLTVLPIGTVNVFAAPSDNVVLPHNVNGSRLDEVQFWPRDLSGDPEMLCENGWDGEWNPATSTCALTSN
jgi:hypothetical protein